MSDDADDASKTEDPSARKLDQARQKGNVASSQEVSSFAILLAGAIVVAAMGPYMGNRLYLAMAGYIEKSWSIPVDRGIGAVMVDTVMDVALAIGPAVLTFMVLGALGKLVQNGPFIASEALQPDLSRLSPLAGFKRLFSLRSIVELVKGLLKMAVVGIILTLIVLPEMNRVEGLMQLEPSEIMRELHAVILQMFVGVVMVMAVIAIADLVYQRYSFTQQMRMTLQEVRDEMKQSDGDPQVRARLRQIRMERARTRMMAAVPQADVVVTNPTHYAIAMKYDGANMAAPVVVAKGVDEVAMRIREVATEHDVPIVENPPLARALFAAVEIDEQIPEEHYKAVAEVISYIYRLKGQRTVH
jgi:flagellar biosynthesis protein FlhB